LRRLDQKGFTLIEIMIVMAMIAAMMALGVSILFPGNDQKVKAEAQRIAGMFKYLYDESVVQKKYFRIAFNIDEKSYRAESSNDSFLIAMEAGADTKSKYSKTAPAPDASPDAATFTEESEDRLLKTKTFEVGVKYKDIQVMHAKEPQTSGVVYGYIFPNGWVEPIIINLTDEEEESVYSLEINPLTGRARIRSEYFQAKEEDLNPGTTP